jgi:hypothetical protein
MRDPVLCVRGLRYGLTDQLFRHDLSPSRACLSHTVDDADSNIESAYGEFRGLPIN